MNAFYRVPPQFLVLAARTPGSVLLQTSRVDEENFRSFLFTQPTQILTARDAIFDQIEEALVEGAWVAGFFAYEFGVRMQRGKVAAPESEGPPEAWFGVYPEPLIFNHLTGSIENSLGDESAGSALTANVFEIRDLRLCIDEQRYAEKIAIIQEYIRAGDTYQVNFTDKLRFGFSGSSQALFAALNESQPVPYSAFLHADDWNILSFSPELFFRRQENRIVTRPMKGTAPRGLDCAEDQAMAEWLKNSPKNRSENVMIVDLLRNDLGRICEYGSIQVDRLFSVEKYETLFQMTSEISGTLRAGVSYSEIFQSLFPCGSVTGAPKLRTMEIIGELEREPRGVYTGAIGYFSPRRESVFNVPIRTVVLKDGRGEMGVGSGIVIDSVAEDEYRECLLKTEFLSRREEPFELIESILWNGGYTMLAMHLERMELSARYFNFRFNREATIAALEEVASRFTADARMKVRVTLNRLGRIEVTASPAAENALGNVIFSTERVSSRDHFLRHKTTRRRFYDRQYVLALERGYVDVLFLNERDEVTEGAISNLFIEKDGRWFTPPVRCGLLPGVYRRHLLETDPRASERVTHLSDIASADAVYLCNAVRGCTKVHVILDTLL